MGTTSTGFAATLWVGGSFCSTGVCGTSVDGDAIVGDVTGDVEPEDCGFVSGSFSWAAGWASGTASVSLVALSAAQISPWYAAKANKPMSGASRARDTDFCVMCCGNCMLEPWSTGSVVDVGANAQYGFTRSTWTTTAHRLFGSEL